MTRKSRKNVGLIGLGIIGTRASAGLRAAGWHVFVWNRTPKPVANFLGSPAEVADICEIIQLFVADAQAVFAMIEALGDSLTERHLVICSATIGPEATLEAARLVEARGAKFLDAPFTGSRGAAERAQLVYYIGGDEAVYARARPVLEATSKAIVRCGKIGDAATLKIVTNLISAVTTQALAEVLAITRRAGIGPDLLAAAIEQNACRSGVIELKLPKMVAGDYEPHFSLKHMFKDVQLGIHLANALNLEIPVTTVTAGVLYGALDQGLGDLDYASVFRSYETDFARFLQRAELESKKEGRADAGAPSAAHDEPESYSEVMPFEIVAEPEKPEGEMAMAAAQVSKGGDDGGSKVLSSLESSLVEMPESKPGAQEVPSEPAAKSDFANAELKSDARERQPEQAKPGEDKPEEAKHDESQPDAMKSGDPAPDAVKEAGSKAEAVKDVNGGTASAGIEGEGEGEGDTAKPVHPFNRILRRFFSPAGK
jgi:3-hydroxyisobutyrate dehydrogenase-like beta-hydroxyacid dehydrogenase